MLSDICDWGDRKSGPTNSAASVRESAPLVVFPK